MEDRFDGFYALDRDALKKKMIEELPDISEKLGVSVEVLEEKAGIKKGKLKEIEAGRRKLKWSEYMSLLFIIWNNNIGRGILESKGLFPQELKEAMSVNRNAHAPTTMSSRYGY